MEPRVYYAPMPRLTSNFLSFRCSLRTVILRTGSDPPHPEIMTHSHLVRFCFGSPLSFRVSEREQERLRCEVLARAHCQRYTTSLSRLFLPPFFSWRWSSVRCQDRYTVCAAPRLRSIKFTRPLCLAERLRRAGANRKRESQMQEIKKKDRRSHHSFQSTVGRDLALDKLNVYFFFSLPFLFLSVIFLKQAVSATAAPLCLFLPGLSAAALQGVSVPPRR